MATDEESTVEHHDCLQRSPPQTLKTNFDTTSNTYQIRWHIDARKLYGNDRHVVSPSLYLSLPQSETAAVFKLMVRAKGNGFKKSRGMGFVELKCESDLLGNDANVTFCITVGRETTGFASHDFRSHPTAVQKQATSLWPAQDPSSHFVLVLLEVHPCVDFREVDAASAVTAHVDAPSPVSSGSARGRSEAGQQRQHERRMARLAERSQMRSSDPNYSSIAKGK